MATYTIIRTSSTEAQVGKDGVFYDDLDITGLDATWRVAKWDGSTGNVELCDGSDYDTNTGESSFASESDIQAAINAWQTAYDTEQAEIALNTAKTEAAQAVYNAAIANGDSEEDASAAANAAAEAVTSA